MLELIEDDDISMLVILYKSYFAEFDSHFVSLDIIILMGHII